MLKDVKCEVKQLIFQRIVQLHSVDVQLPTDLEAQSLKRADETLVEVKSGSHSHQKDLPDPIVDATTFDDLLNEVNKRKELIKTEAANITKEQLAGIRLLISDGISLEKISELLKISIPAIKFALGL